jgi:hypothetical protein
MGEMSHPANKKQKHVMAVGLLPEMNAHAFGMGVPGRLHTYARMHRRKCYPERLICICLINQTQTN